MGDVLEPIALGASGAGAIMSAGGAYSKSAADRSAYETQSTALSNNAELECAAAGDAIRRGQTAQVNAALRARQVKGQQIAAMAANGVALDEGTPLNILTDTDLTAANDANVIAMNAAKEAWGYNVRAGNDEANAALLRRRAEMESPGRSAATSLLTSAGTVASRWYSTRHAYALGDA
jgi:hypothetical protein